MQGVRRTGIVHIVMVCLTLSATAFAVDGSPARGQAGGGPLVSAPVTPKVSPEVRSLPSVAPWREGDPVPEMAGGRSDRPGSPGPTVRDPLVDQGGRATVAQSPAPLRSFDGIAATGAVPPDTIGDVGPNHYVQMVNVRFAIYDKTGTVLKAPTNINQLWAGAGGRCEATNSGDPVVLYDPLADRWLLSQFARPAPFAVCVAISRTPDPTGAYYLYEFPVSVFPDYLKFGVWPDGYYMTTNESGQASAYSVGAFAFDRRKMLTGEPATLQKFTVDRNFMLPADLDGATPPPVGAPNPFYTLMDDEFWPSQGFAGTDRLEVWSFHVDWDTPANSTFQLTDTLPTAPFNYLVCGFFDFQCIPQPAPGQLVDALSEWPMWRLAYRNFGSYEALVGNFTVRVGDPERAGIRWFELRSSGGGDWTIYQEGTHAPDSSYRWIGSAAMDRSGNIALGYNVSSTSLNPAIRYATRLYTDTLGTLQEERSLIEGGGVQTNGGNRWGDYSAMSVDPADDCTFWYTNQYYATTSQRSWSTRIGAFRLPSCGVAQASLAASFDPPTAKPGQQVVYRLLITNTSLVSVTDALVVGELSPGLTAAGPTTVDPPGAGEAGTPPTLVSGLTIPPGAVVRLTLPVTVATGLATGTQLQSAAQISSPNLSAQAALASVRVTNAAPLAGADSAETLEATSVTIQVLGNDSDPNGDTLTVSVETQPAHGTAVSDGGSIVYTPAPGFSGQDSFTYRVSDGELSATAPVGVSVTPTSRRTIYLPVVKR